MIKVGIIGVGTVGSSVVNFLQRNKEIITQRAGQEIVPVLGIVKNLDKKRDVNIRLSDNIDDVLNNDDIDLVVELVGGIDKPKDVVLRALNSGKNVVTANKAMLAYHRYEISNCVGEKFFGYEASVAGGIPIINALREGLSANNILSIKGIMNGTCNYILTKMMNEGASYIDTLKEAQELGYAEADPTFDVGGFDAAHKLLILASIAYNIDAKPEDILIEGIENIRKDDIIFAKEFGYTIKLLGIAKQRNNEIELRMHPVLIKNSEAISKVDGVMNGISILGDAVGETLYYGPGAGGDATASAVISDIIDIARGNKTPTLGFSKTQKSSSLKLLDKDDILTKYYLRIKVSDEVGVLAKITNIFANHSISIDTFLQRPSSDEGSAMLLFSTHVTKEKNILNSASELEKLNFVQSRPIMIRIED
jgi:homoserine dehydrogenase